MSHLLLKEEEKKNNNMKTRELTMGDEQREKLKSANDPKHANSSEEETVDYEESEERNPLKPSATERSCGTKACREKHDKRRIQRFEELSGSRASRSYCNHLQLSFALRLSF